MSHGAFPLLIIVRWTCVTSFFFMGHSRPIDLPANVLSLGTEMSHRFRGQNLPI